MNKKTKITHYSKGCTHTHPVTSMYYRKRYDGRFEFLTEGRLFRKGHWVISGMSSGFLDINNKES